VQLGWGPDGARIVAHQVRAPWQVWMASPPVGSDVLGARVCVLVGWWAGANQGDKPVKLLDKLCILAAQQSTDLGLWASSLSRAVDPEGSL
jgi:hypothetical protein